MTRPHRPAGDVAIDLIGPSMQVILHAVLVASVYLLVAGHNHPGGGFVGGLVASAGIAVEYVTGGIGAVRRLARFRPWTVLGSGVLLAVLTASTPLLFGRPVLDSAKWDLDLPLFGHVAVSSVLVFDIGVYLVVVGLTLMVFEAFGDDYTGDLGDENSGGRTVSTILALSAAALFGIGTYLVLQRKLSRIIVGLGLLSHGANVLLLTSGRAGIEPFVGAADPAEMADPMPHALALTTIVITFGVSALLLAMAFRSWILTDDDEVENDLADVLVTSGGVASKEVVDEAVAEAEAEAENELAASLASRASRVVE